MNRYNTDSTYFTNCHRKQTTYWEGYLEARKVANYLRDQGIAPECRVVSFERGFAIQKRISGPYWFMPESKFL